eukprot:2281965-Rhodomonas_salina.1
MLSLTCFKFRVSDGCCCAGVGAAPSEGNLKPQIEPRASEREHGVVYAAAHKLGDAAEREQHHQRVPYVPRLERAQN